MNRRMIPLLVDVTFINQSIWRSMFSDVEPLFHITTKTLSETVWKIERTYKDFEVLR